MTLLVLGTDAASYRMWVEGSCAATITVKSVLFRGNKALTSLGISQVQGSMAWGIASAFYHAGFFPSSLTMHDVAYVSNHADVSTAAALFYGTGGRVSSISPNFQGGTASLDMRRVHFEANVAGYFIATYVWGRDLDGAAIFGRCLNCVEVAVIEDVVYKANKVPSSVATMRIIIMILCTVIHKGKHGFYESYNNNTAMIPYYLPAAAATSCGRRNLLCA